MSNATDLELPRWDPSLPPWQGHEESAGRFDIYVRRTAWWRTGEGAANVVYVHGLGGSSTNWTDLGYLLAPWGHGIAVDLPGFGFSEPADGFELTMHAQADGLADYIACLDEGAVHLVGNSMGGVISLLLAARRPDLVRTLTLISPAMPDLRPDPRRLSDPRVALTVLPGIGKRVRKKLAALGPRERARQVINLCFADPQSFPANRFDELAEEHGARMNYPWAMPALTRSTVGLIRTWMVSGARSLWSAAREVQAPTLVIWGEQDRVVGARKARRTTNALPNGRLLLLPEAGHVAQMERPVAVAEAIVRMWYAAAEDQW